MYSAIKTENIEYIKYLLKRGANPNSKFSALGSSIERAIDRAFMDYDSYSETFKLIVDAINAPEALDHALWYCKRYNDDDSEIVKIIMKKKATLDC